MRKIGVDVLRKICSTGDALRERLWALKLSPEAGVHELEIPDPGTGILKNIENRRSSQRRRGSSTLDVTNKALSWKCMGLRFGQIPSGSVAEEGLYIDNVKRDNPGTA